VTWFRNPLVAVGLALTLLGLGNWYTGRSKLSHYRAVLAEQHGSQPLVDHSEFPNLDEVMNTSLLRPLRSVSGEYRESYDKIELYRIVDLGGRMLAALGVTSVAVGAILLRRRLHPLH